MARRLKSGSGEVEGYIPTTYYEIIQDWPHYYILYNKLIAHNESEDIIGSNLSSVFYAEHNPQSEKKKSWYVEREMIAIYLIPLICFIIVMLAVIVLLIVFLQCYPDKEGTGVPEVAGPGPGLKFLGEGVLGNQKRKASDLQNLISDTESLVTIRSITRPAGLSDSLKVRLVAD